MSSSSNPHTSPISNRTRPRRASANIGAVPASTAALQTQAVIYRNVLDRCLLQPACAGFQMWGFTDRYSWIPGQYPGHGQALGNTQPIDMQQPYSAGSLYSTVEDLLKARSEEEEAELKSLVKMY